MKHNSLCKEHEQSRESNSIDASKVEHMTSTLRKSTHANKALRCKNKMIQKELSELS